MTAIKTATALVLLALLLAVPAAQATLVDEHGFVGRTSQDEDIGLDRDGNLVGGFEYSIDSPCTNGRSDSTWFYEDLGPFRVARDGRFSGSWTQTDFSYDPFMRSAEYRIRGRFVRRGRTVRGVMSAKVVGLDGTVCRSGRVTFTAYAG
jgi:hypothetical protein